MLSGGVFDEEGKLKERRNSDGKNRFSSAMP